MSEVEGWSVGRLRERLRQEVDAWCVDGRRRSRARSLAATWRLCVTMSTVLTFGGGRLPALLVAVGLVAGAAAAQGPRADDELEATIAPLDRVAPASPRTRFAGGIVFAQAVPPDARGAYRRALEELRGGRRGAATALLRDAVVRFPDYFDASFALGVVAGADGDFAAAEAALARALRVNGRDPRAHLFRGMALVGLADAERNAAPRAARLDDAAIELDRAWELSGHTLAGVLLQRARVLERLGDRAGAADALEQYLVAAPRAANADALRNAAATLRGR